MSWKTRGVKVDLKKFIKALVNRPRRQLRSLMPELQTLCKTLKASAEMGDPLAGITMFYDHVSRWHDRGLDDLIAMFVDVNYKRQHDDVIRKLRTLHLYFDSVGRKESGPNRTKPGERVTESKIYLGGNTVGLRNEPISYWRKTRGEKRSGPNRSHAQGFSSYDLVCHQASQFLKSHSQKICDLIGSLGVEAR